MRDSVRKQPRDRLISLWQLEEIERQECNEWMSLLFDTLLCISLYSALSLYTTLYYTLSYLYSFNWIYPLAISEGYWEWPFLRAMTVNGSGIESASVLCYSPISGQRMQFKIPHWNTITWMHSPIPTIRIPTHDTHTSTRTHTHTHSHSYAVCKFRKTKCFNLAEGERLFGFGAWALSASDLFSVVVLRVKLY